MKKKPTIEIYVCLAFILMGVVWIYQAGTLSTNQLVSVYIGADAFPKYLAIAMIIMCVWTILESMFKKPGKDEVKGELESMLEDEDADNSLVSSELSADDERRIRRKGMLRAICLILLAAVYVLVLKKIGYLIATMLFVAGGLAAFGVKTPWKIALTAFLTSGTLYLVFVNLLKVALP